MRIGSASLKNLPATGSTSGTKQPSSPTPCTTGRPFAWHSRMSSSPYAGAQCTMPVPSSMVTKSAVHTWQMGPSAERWSNSRV